MSRVFVSSTCYDLIDLRVEVEKQLLDLGLRPIMSDRPSVEFKIIPDANSIETCLTNVRNSDIFLIILSQRYGPSLKPAGYLDVSATHLEYKEAKRLKKPIYMYVRDRLDSDFTIWKRNRGKEVDLSWVKKGDENIFSLIEEHGKLVASAKKSNWFWVFRDSCELKTRIQQDLQKDSGKAILAKLIESGKMAHLIPQIKEWSVDILRKELKMCITVINAGSSAAIHPMIGIDGRKIEELKEFVSLLPGEAVNVDFLLKLSPKLIREANPVFEVNFSYSTAEGHYVGDEFDLELSWEKGETTGWKSFMYSAKRYYHSAAFTIKTRDEK